MKYISIPTCPYCRKRINIIRVWSMKKHGEFMCPRCKGISNIFLSPLIYVTAVIAISAAFLIYFFQKFILDSLGLWSILHVFLPFAGFFLLSLFMVYLEKPVIKRVRKTADGRYFDENGNELKMRMGKLVAASGNGVSGAVPPGRESAVYNTDDMTGRVDQPPRRRESPVSVSAALNDLDDNEDLYAAAATKLGRDFTTQIDPKALKTPVQPPVRLADRGAEGRHMAPERPVRPVIQQTPPTRVAPSAPVSAAAPTPLRAEAPSPVRSTPPPSKTKEEVVPLRRSTNFGAPVDLPPAKVRENPAPVKPGESSGIRPAKEGFEDLYEEYNKRVALENEKEDKKGGSFRQL